MAATFRPFRSISPICPCTRVIALWLALFAGPAAASAGSVTYKIANYPAQQDGWTVSGSITTDGTIGAIAEKSITSWTWTISNGNQSYTYSTKDKGASLKVNGLTATATELVLPLPPGTQETNILKLRDNSFMGELQSLPAALTWSLSGSKGRSSFYTANYLQKKEVPQAWDTSTRKLGGKSPWVIASVPEPAGLVLLGTGALGALLYQRARGRGRRAGHL